VQQRLRLNKPERSGSVKRPYCDSSRRNSSARWDLETMRCITITGVYSVLYALVLDLFIV